LGSPFAVIRRPERGRNAAGASMVGLVLIVIVMFNKLSPERKRILKSEIAYPQERAISLNVRPAGFFGREGKKKNQ
jgi:hypothetical protein